MLGPERVFRAGRADGAEPASSVRCRVAAVLAGGGSRRMGTDKARVQIGSTTLLDQALRRAMSVADRVLLIGRRLDAMPVRSDRRPAGTARRLSVESHLDAYPDAGPLGGIATALKLSRPHACLITPCDMPLLEVELLECLIRAHTEDVDYTLIKNPLARYPEPLVGVYAARCLPVIEQAISEGQLAIWRALSGMARRCVEVSPAEAEQLANLNTPRDLLRLGVSVS